MKVKEIVRKCQFPLILSPGFYAASVCISAYITPELLPYLWLLPLCYILCSGLILSISGKMRLLPLFAGWALLLSPAAFLSGDARVLMLVYGLCYSGLLLYSLYMAGWERTKELGVGWVLGVFVLLIISCFFATYEKRLASASNLIRGSVFVFTLLVLFSMNRGSYNLATGGDQGFSASMRQKNMLLTLGMFVIAVLVALVPSLAKLAEAVVAWIAGLIKSIAAMIPEETEPPQTTTLATEAETMGEGLNELTEGLPINQTSESTYAMMWVIAICVFLPMLVIVTVKLGKMLLMAMQNIYAKINNAVSAEMADYVDEITDLREERRTERSQRKADAAPTTGRNRLTPAAKVRKQYKQLRQRHSYWTDQSTARENLTEEAARIYEQARYSEHPLEEQDVERFKSETQF